MIAAFTMYVIVCDACGSRAPGGMAQDELLAQDGPRPLGAAIRSTIPAGWACTGRGFRDVCPDCREKEEAR